MSGCIASVIVPAKNAEETIHACLSSLKKQAGFKYGEDYEVILVDDGSTDKTAEIAESCGVIVLKQKNYGPAAARNPLGC